MKLIYGYDFETTGFPLWKEPSSHPDQPHIVQCAAQLVDADTREVISSFDLIAKPEGWDIPAEVSEVHGITTEKARDVGINEGLIVAMLLAFHSLASLRIAHNQPFDARIMRVALKRFSNETRQESWKAGEAYCTQSKSTPIVKAPPSAKMLAAGRKGNKTANLQEAYTHFIGKPFENAHSALADVEACLAVYWAIQDLDAAALETVKIAGPGRPSEGPGSGSGGDGVGFL